jgi:hypothetical protein
MNGKLKKDQDCVVIHPAYMTIIQHCSKSYKEGLCDQIFRFAFGTIFFADASIVSCNKNRE